MLPKLHNLPSEREGLTDQEYYATLPKKRIGAGVLLFYKSELLIVQPTYSLGWMLPGGTIEAEESPLEGLYREVKEELGLHIQPEELLSIDYIANLDVKGEYIQFLFSAQELSEEQVNSIEPSEELGDFKFVPLEKAFEQLIPAASKRVQSSLEAQDKKTCYYLENGKPLKNYLRLSIADL